MDQEKIGQFIKKLRIDNNMTQKDFADKYHVTFQSVSKWENGKNIPDGQLLIQMSHDFNVSIDDIYRGEISKKDNKKRNITYIVGAILSIIVILIAILAINRGEDKLHFRELEATCSNFAITGNISYNKDNSYIYISSISYNTDDNSKYSKVYVNLYEHDTLLDSYTYEGESNTLKKILENVKFIEKGFDNKCSEYDNDTFYLNINAYLSNGELVNYRVPLGTSECI